MPNLGWQELLLIMIFALVVFGPKRLPEIGRQVGKAIREVRKVSGQFQEEIKTGLALDDDDGNFPYMSGPAGKINVTPQQPAQPLPAGGDDVVRYGEIAPSPPAPPAEPLS